MIYTFNEVFNVEGGRISPKIPVNINGVTMGPGVSFGAGVSFGGVDLSQFTNCNLEAEEINGVLSIKGFYK